MGPCPGTDVGRKGFDGRAVLGSCFLFQTLFLKLWDCAPHTVVWKMNLSRCLTVAAGLADVFRDRTRSLSQAVSILESQHPARILGRKGADFIE
jgi:hypothetical protein